MSEPEFRIITIIIILAGVENRLEFLSVEIKEIKASQDEIKNAITEMQSHMDATVTRINEAEQRISDTKDKIMENNEAEKKREIEEKDHDLRIREVSDSLKRNNIRIIGVPEEEEREIGVEGLCEQIIAENFPNLGKDTDIKIQEAQRIPIRFNKNRPSIRHIIVKFTKYSGKERIKKAAREKKVPNLQGKTDQVCSRPIHRKLAGQKGVAGYIQCAESEKYAAKKSFSSKAVIQNRRRDKKFRRQRKTKGVCDD